MYICNENKYKLEQMNTAAAGTGKSPMAFRFRNDLVGVIKDEAKKENRSLNNFLENLLINYFNVDEKIPNAITIAAIEEAKAGKCTGRIDTSSMEAFIKSCEE
jgi:hypothetical protein